MKKKSKSYSADLEDGKGGIERLYMALNPLFHLFDIDITNRIFFDLKSLLTKLRDKSEFLNRFLSHIFYLYDVDDSGEIEEDEFVQILTDIGVATNNTRLRYITGKEVQGILEEMNMESEVGLGENFLMSKSALVEFLKKWIERGGEIDEKTPQSTEKGED